MRIIVVALFALVLIFQIFQYTQACKCCCGCGCGGCGGCGCGGCGGCGCCGYNGYNNAILQHHVIRESAPAALCQPAAPSVVGIPIFSGLGSKGCGCRGPCSCWD